MCTKVPDGKNLKNTDLWNLMECHRHMDSKKPKNGCFAKGQNDIFHICVPLRFAMTVKNQTHSKLNLGLLILDSDSRIF